MECKKCGHSDEYNMQGELVRESGLYAVLCEDCWYAYGVWESTDPAMIAMRNRVQQVAIQSARGWLLEKRSADV